MRFVEFPTVMPGMRGWAASVGQYHFVITHEDGGQLGADDRDQWTGYTASFKSYEGRDKPAVRIDGIWKSFTEAEEACKATWRQLRQQH